MAKPITSYTAALDETQARLLREVLEERGFAFGEKAHALWAASRGKLNVTVYEKGPKVLVQGRETGDFVRYLLEPEILGEAKLGYEEVHQPEMFTPHLGIDESGKGYFFGPLVIAGVYTDDAIARALLEAGVMDSKRVTSDANRKVKATPTAAKATLAIRMRTSPPSAASVVRLIQTSGATAT